MNRTWLMLVFAVVFAVSIILVAQTCHEDDEFDEHTRGGKAEIKSQDKPAAMQAPRTLAQSKQDNTPSPEEEKVVAEKTSQGAKTVGEKTAEGAKMLGEKKPAPYVPSSKPDVLVYEERLKALKEMQSDRQVADYYQKRLSETLQSQSLTTGRDGMADFYSGRGILGWIQQDDLNSAIRFPDLYNEQNSKSSYDWERIILAAINGSWNLRSKDTGLELTLYNGEGSLKSYFMENDEPVIVQQVVRARVSEGGVLVRGYDPQMVGPYRKRHSYAPVLLFFSREPQSNQFKIHTRSVEAAEWSPVQVISHGLVP